MRLRKVGSHLRGAVGIAAFFVLSFVVPASGQDPPRSPMLWADNDSALAKARMLIDDGEYDKAIGLLETILDATRRNDELLQQTYLLLVESYVYNANADGISPLVSSLYRNKAKTLVQECLSISALRHTRPDPTRVPTEMLDLFEEVRRELFGTVWIRSVDPPDAEVILDGERLARGTDGAWLAEDVPVGNHILHVRHPDRRSTTQEFPLSAGERYVQHIRLESKRGWGWYAPRVTFVGVLATVIAISIDDDPSAEEILDGSPPVPPAAHR